jgi:Ca2+:H+ antiporter
MGSPIDAIKRAAKREVFSSDGNSKTKFYHPLTRKISRPRQTDEEAAPYREPEELGSASGVDATNGSLHRRPSDGEKGVEGEGDGNSVTSGDSEEREKAEKERAKAERWKRQPVWPQVRTVVFPHWYTLNWLLLTAPIGIGLHFTKVNPLAPFLVNFIAIIPLAGLLSFATEEIAERVGEVLGGVLNASFGNAVELIVGIIALKQNKIVIVQTSLIGSMLSNLLLVLGMCFFFGGIHRLEQFFNETVAQTAASLLALSVGSLIIPTAFTWGPTGITASKTNVDEELSHGTAIILLAVYAAYLFFQLKSHKEMYNAPSRKVEKRKGSKKAKGEAKRALAAIGGIVGAGSGGHAQAKRQVVLEEEDGPKLDMYCAIGTLCGATALIGLCSEFLVDSINDVTCEYGVSDYFVGLILLPIVGNAAEHATAVTVAMKDKMDLAIGVAVGSSMQIALLVIPIMVIVGWGIGVDMTLVFDDFQIAVLFVAVILVNYLIADGKSRKWTGCLIVLDSNTNRHMQTGSKAFSSYRCTSL